MGFLGLYGREVSICNLLIIQLIIDRSECDSDFVFQSGTVGKYYRTCFSPFPLNQHQGITSGWNDSTRAFDPAWAWAAWIRPATRACRISSTSGSLRLAISIIFPDRSTGTRPHFVACSIDHSKWGQYTRLSVRDQTLPELFGPLVQTVMEISLVELDLALEKADAKGSDGLANDESYRKG